MRRGNSRIFWAVGTYARGVAARHRAAARQDRIVWGASVQSARRPGAGIDRVHEAGDVLRRRERVGQVDADRGDRDQVGLQRRGWLDGVPLLDGGEPLRTLRLP